MHALFGGDSRIYFCRQHLLVRFAAKVWHTSIDLLPACLLDDSWLPAPPNDGFLGPNFGIFHPHNASNWRESVSKTAWEIHQAKPRFWDHLAFAYDHRPPAFFFSRLSFCEERLHCSLYHRVDNLVWQGHKQYPLNSTSFLCRVLPGQLLPRN